MADAAKPFGGGIFNDPALVAPPMTGKSPFEIVQALEAQFAALPPAPFFASSTLFGRKAYRFTVGGREHIGAHPDFWAKIPAQPARTANPLCEIQIVDLDADRAASRAFFAAMDRALFGDEAPKP